MFVRSRLLLRWRSHLRDAWSFTVQVVLLLPRTDSDRGGGALCGLALGTTGSRGRGIDGGRGGTHARVRAGASVQVDGVQRRRWGAVRSVARQVECSSVSLLSILTARTAASLEALNDGLRFVWLAQHQSTPPHDESTVSGASARQTIARALKLSARLSSECGTC